MPSGEWKGFISMLTLLSKPQISKFCIIVKQSTTKYDVLLECGPPHVQHGYFTTFSQWHCFVALLLYTSSFLKLHNIYWCRLRQRKSGFNRSFNSACADSREWIAEDVVGWRKWTNPQIIPLKYRLRVGKSSKATEREVSRWATNLIISLETLCWLRNNLIFCAEHNTSLKFLLLTFSSWCRGGMIVERCK